LGSRENESKIHYGFSCSLSLKPKKRKKKQELMHCVYLIEAGIEIATIKKQYGARHGNRSWWP